MKIIFLLVTFYFTAGFSEIKSDGKQLFVKIMEGGREVNVPMMWSFNLFEELEKKVTNVSKYKVYYITIMNNAGLGFPSSTSKTIGVQRGSKKGDFKISGQLATSEDIVQLAYNQKLVVYIANQEGEVVTINVGNHATKEKSTVLFNYDNPSDWPGLIGSFKKAVEEAAEFQFSSGKKKNTFIDVIKGIVK